MPQDEIDARIVDAAYSSEPPRTEETQSTLRSFRKRLRSSMRIVMGQIMEDDEFKQARENERKLPLPS